MLSKLIGIATGRDTQSGGAVVLFAVSLLLLMGFLGLVLDIGIAYYQKRQMQTAADASAFAAAHTLLRKNAGAIKSNAVAEGQENGYPVEIGDIHRPPLSGNFKGDSAFVEVYVKERQSTIFMQIFEPSQDELGVTTRAVAGLIPGPGCIHVLDGQEEKAFHIQSDSRVLASECGVIVHSCDSKALYVDSNKKHVPALKASTIDVCGGVYQDNDQDIFPVAETGQCSPEKESRCAPGPDPLWYVPEPVPPIGCDYNEFKVDSGGQTDIYPGSYCDGIIVSGSETTVTFHPGIYWLKGGGLQIESGATAYGQNVGFYNTGNKDSFKSINVSSGSTVQFTAPTQDSLASDGTHPMEGILFFQDRTISNEGDPWKWQNKIESGTNSYFKGTLYFPTQHLLVHSNTASDSAASWSLIIANTLHVTSDAIFDVGSNLGGERSPLLQVTLVE